MLTGGLFLFLAAEPTTRIPAFRVSAIARAAPHGVRGTAPTCATSNVSVPAPPPAAAQSGTRSDSAGGNTIGPRNQGAGDNRATDQKGSMDDDVRDKGTRGNSATDYRRSDPNGMRAFADATRVRHQTKADPASGAPARLPKAGSSWHRSLTTTVGGGRRLLRD